MTEFPLKFEREQRQEIAGLFQDYLRRELDVDAGGLAAGFLVDFAGSVIGPLYYNEGLRDALAAAARHMDGLEVDVFALEREPGTGQPEPPA